MSKRPTTRAARHQRVREKIQASKLVTQLQKHALGQLPDGKEMSPSQVQAAVTLLDRVAPKLKSVEVQKSTDEELAHKDLVELTSRELSYLMLKDNEKLASAFQRFLKEGGVCKDLVGSAGD